MRGWVIFNTTMQAYVAPPGRHRSFTRDVLKARRFPTREAAQADCCGNERVVSLQEVMDCYNNLFGA